MSLTLAFSLNKFLCARLFKAQPELLLLSNSTVKAVKALKDMQEPTLSNNVTRFSEDKLGHLNAQWSVLSCYQECTLPALPGLPGNDVHVHVPTVHTSSAM